MVKSNNWNLASVGSDKFKAFISPYSEVAKVVCEGAAIIWTAISCKRVADLGWEEGSWSEDMSGPVRSGLLQLGGTYTQPSAAGYCPQPQTLPTLPFPWQLSSTKEGVRSVLCPPYSSGPYHEQYGRGRATWPSPIHRPSLHCSSPPTAAGPGERHQGCSSTTCPPVVSCSSSCCTTARLLTAPLAFRL